MAIPLRSGRRAEDAGGASAAFMGTAEATPSRRRLPGESAPPEPFDNRVVEPRDALQRHFGHGTFRPGQEDVVRAALSGQDLLAVMPTGSGKSIGYQLPAVLLNGPTLVVSPLIALMKDQVDELSRKGIPAAAVHSLPSPAERRAAEGALRGGRLRLLCVAPERFASASF